MPGERGGHGTRRAQAGAAEPMAGTRATGSEVKLEPALKRKRVLDGRAGRRAQRAQPGQRCTEHRVFRNGWWLWKGARSDCPDRDTSSIRERAEPGQLLSLRALGLVGGVPKPNLLIRSAQPGPASLR